MQKIYSCQIYNAKKAFIYLSLLFVIFIAFIILAGRILNLPMLAVILFIGMVISLAIFSKQFQLKFTRRADLTFNQKQFSISIYDLNDDQLIKQLDYNWNDIKSYKFYFTPSNLTYLDIFLRSGSKREYGFKDKDENASIKEESVFTLFRSFVGDFNSSTDSENKVNLAPGFLTTPPGTVILTFAAVLMMAAIIVTTIKKGNHFAFLLIAFLPSFLF